jgi:pimeloyl-ACP methyl ester carboxylesterase
MTTFAMVHGGGGSGWEWHLVDAELSALGHRCVAPDLPAEESTTLDDCADAVVAAIGDDDGDVVVVGHSFGAFAAPLVAVRRPTAGLVLVAGMVPRPGESPADWWTATGHADAVAAQAAADGGLTGNDDPMVCYFHDVPADLATQALAHESAHPSMATYTQPWPLASWPDVPTRFVVCTEDRVLPAGFLRRIVRERIAITPDELASGHCADLAQPQALAALLASYQWGG